MGFRGARAMLRNKHRYLTLQGISKLGTRSNKHIIIEARKDEGGGEDNLKIHEK